MGQGRFNRCGSARVSGWGWMMGNAESSMFSPKQSRPTASPPDMYSITQSFIKVNAFLEFRKTIFNGLGFGDAASVK